MTVQRQPLILRSTAFYFRQSRICSNKRLHYQCSNVTPGVPMLFAPLFSSCFQVGGWAKDAFVRVEVQAKTSKANGGTKGIRSRRLEGLTNTPLIKSDS
jgi:hypothetical protein